MGHDATILDRLLASRDPLEQTNALLKSIVGLDINEVGSRQAVLRDEDGSSIPLDSGQQFRRFSLQGGNKFCAHKVIL